jgi:hypothetical protein
MPKVDGPRGAAAATPPAQETEDLFTRFDEAFRTFGGSAANAAVGLGGLLASAKRGAGALSPDLGCSCAKCLRKAGPVREDAE